MRVPFTLYVTRINRANVHRATLTQGATPVTSFSGNDAGRFHQH
jgi:hypothetical protein